MRNADRDADIFMAAASATCGGLKYEAAMGVNDRYSANNAIKDGNDAVERLAELPAETIAAIAAKADVFRHAAENSSYIKKNGHWPACA